MTVKFKLLPSFLACVMLLTACQTTIPKEALQLSQESLALKQLQTRRFETTNEKKLLKAGAAVLQDLGYTIEESETALGVIVASKSRSAVNGGQIAGALILAALSGTYVPTDKEQKIRVSLICSKPSKKHTNFRVTFQRMVWDTQGNITRAESLEDEELYTEFFSKLSKSVFLEAHKI